MKFMSRERKPGIPFLMLGVVFPALVLILEVTTGMCGEQFLDPVPTVFHMLLIALVPAANLLVWLVARDRGTAWIKLISLLNGIAIGISAYYCLLFTPLVPLALIALLYGIGILPLAPFFALGAAIRGRLFLRSRFESSSGERLHALWPGIAVSVLAIVLAELPGTITRVGLHLAASQNRETRLTGIRILRNFGSEDFLLRACYQRPGVMTDPLSAVISMGEPVRPVKAREAYYQVTGRTCNSVPQPGPVKRNVFFRYGPRFDRDQGTRAIGSEISGLSLESSRLDGSLDPDAALAYLQWTMEFRNESELQQEARTQLLLPHDAVVSRLTLWIDGQEREAAFAGRTQVTKAYQEVVRTRRDPVLVTTDGPDRILVQCFPVAPRGGTMKIRLGITAPLQLISSETGLLRLPSIMERNFGISRISHLVWMESKRKLIPRTPSLVEESAGQGSFALRGALTDEALSDPARGTIAADRNPETTTAWTEDLIANSGHAVVQTVSSQVTSKPSRVVLVIDGSVGMADSRRQIVDALGELLEDSDVAALIAGDDVIDVSGPSQVRNRDLLELIGHRIARHQFRGGCDSVPALARAWDLAVQQQNSAIVWIHGPQPVLIEPVESLKQRWDRRPEGPTLYAVQAANGPNRIIENLECVAQFQSVPRSGTLTEDLSRFFGRWHAKAALLSLLRERSPVADAAEQLHGKHTSPHLARLWANEEAIKLCSAKKPDTDRKAAELAIQYQLVTPRTGAVVLETAEQFKRHSLTPASAAAVPTIPEPEVWMLVAVATTLLLLVVSRRRTWLPS